MRLNSRLAKLEQREAGRARRTQYTNQGPTHSFDYAEYQASFAEAIADLDQAGLDTWLTDFGRLLVPEATS